MEILTQTSDLFLHLDQGLASIIAVYGIWTYLILFLVIFCETGLVVTPFLPGDSLLFAAGAFAALGALDATVLVALLATAAVLGDAVNYACGAYLGPKVLRRENGWFLRKDHLDRTRRFYEKYGNLTIVLARFVPIVRTFAPFLAGVGRMPYLAFATYNITGGLLWVTAFVLGGVFFGNIPTVQEHFTLVILGIIILSVLPGAAEFVRSRYKSSPPVS